MCMAFAPPITDTHLNYVLQMVEVMSTDSSNLRGKCMDYALKTLDMFCYADLTVVSITPSKTSLDHLMAETGLTRDQCRRIYDIVIQTGQDIG
jgi:hypothetical protein